MLQQPILANLTQHPSITKVIELLKNYKKYLSTYKSDEKTIPILTIHQQFIWDLLHLLEKENLQPNDIQACLNNILSASFIETGFFSNTTTMQTLLQKEKFLPSNMPKIATSKEIAALPATTSNFPFFTSTPQQPQLKGILPQIYKILKTEYLNTFFPPDAITENRCISAFKKQQESITDTGEGFSKKALLDLNRNVIILNFPTPYTDEFVTTGKTEEEIEKILFKFIQIACLQRLHPGKTLVEIYGNLDALLKELKNVEKIDFERQVDELLIFMLANAGQTMFSLLTIGIMGHGMQLKNTPKDQGNPIQPNEGTTRVEWSITKDGSLAYTISTTAYKIFAPDNGHMILEKNRLKPLSFEEGKELGKQENLPQLLKLPPIAFLKATGSFAPLKTENNPTKDEEKSNKSKTVTVDFQVSSVQTTLFTNDIIFKPEQDPLAKDTEMKREIKVQ